MNFDIRKQLLEFDNVMNKQREAIYSLRNEILEGEDISQQVKDMASESVDEKLGMWASKKHPEEWDWQNLNSWLNRVFNIELRLSQEQTMNFSTESLKEFIEQKILEVYSQREKDFGESLIREVERMILLRMMDTAWREHLYELDHLKKGIGLRAYGQKDPVIEYKQESFKLFGNMMNRIRESTVEYVFRFRPSPGPFRRTYPAVSMPSGKSKPEDKKMPEIVTAAPKKIGRNDPCPCGSGKKYKKCCGR